MRSTAECGASRVGKCLRLNTSSQKGALDAPVLYWNPISRILTTVHCHFQISFELPNPKTIRFISLSFDNVRKEKFKRYFSARKPLSWFQNRTMNLDARTHAGTQDSSPATGRRTRSRGELILNRNRSTFLLSSSFSSRDRVSCCAIAKHRSHSLRGR